MGPGRPRIDLLMEEVCIAQVCSSHSRTSMINISDLAVSARARGDPGSMWASRLFDLPDGVADLFRMHGVSVRVAYDDPSAIKSALDAVPDVILCDLGLPGGMDGFALARACRPEKSLRGIRLVAVSGYSSAEVRPV